MIALGSSRGLAQIAAIRRIFARTLATEGRRLDALGWRTLNDARDEAWQVGCPETLGVIDEVCCGY
jgi:hypothetical protein